MSRTMANSVDNIPSFSPLYPFSSLSPPSSPSSSIFDHTMSPPPPPLFHQKASSFGSFKDLLTLHDFNPDLLDWYPTTPITALSPPPPSPTQISHSVPSPATSNLLYEYSSEVLNTTTPTTPNSSSFSSSPNGPGNEPAEPENEDQDQNKDQDQNQNQLNGKKKQKKQKKEKEPRFAFMTKSDVDHLDDGYRWRKYGQKAVKNSPNPRSYYRCTTAGCGVKKRVERSAEDASVVVTTYEGVHTHPCPGSRASQYCCHGGFGPAANNHGGGAVPGLGCSNHREANPPPQHLQHLQNQSVLRVTSPLTYKNAIIPPAFNVANPAATNGYFNATSNSSFGSFNNIQGYNSNGGGFVQSSRFMANDNVNQGLVMDNGLLLQDIFVPAYHME